VISLKLNHQINFYLTSLLAFFTPIYSKILPVFIILLVVNWLINPTNIKLSLKNLKSNYVLLASIGLYLLYLLGMLYSFNLSFGAKVLETKLSLLLLPLVYAAYIDVTKEKINTYLKYFVFGCIFYGIVCFGHATYAYFKPVYVDLYGYPYYLGFNYFYYTYLSVFFHPSYSAMFSVFGLWIIIIGLLRKEVALNWKSIFAIVFLSVFILLLSSKAGWLSLFLIILFSLGSLLVAKKTLQILYFLVPIIGLFLIFNVYNTTSYSDRLPKLENILKAFTEKDENNKEVTTSKDGNASRIFIWKASTHLFMQNWLMGVGTGDAKDELMKEYQVRGMTTEHEIALNSHNQFLSTAIAIGIIGLIILLLMLIYPFIIATKQHNYIVIGFVVLLLINLLVESMFETQAGLVFYAFMSTIIYSTLLRNTPNNRRLSSN
jgi:O-antigen ligase